jgi:uncharacterized membrane protein YkvA (DUF1232 family)
MKFSVESLYRWYHDLLQNPKYRWWVIIGTITYLISPIDIAPDFLPIIGQVDDVLLLTLLVSEVSGLIVGSWKSRHSNPVEDANNTTKDVTSTENTIDVDVISVK